MNSPRPDALPAAPHNDQRQALENSERAASEKQPGSFEDEAIDKKIVEIPPVGSDTDPIRGLDSK